MSFNRSYEEAKASYKPMRRTAMRSRTSLKRSKPMKRSRMKRSKISPEETAWREEVLKRDGYQCRWIDETGKRCQVKDKENLDAHHISERSQRPDLILDLDNGAALCGGPGRHHDRLHHTVEGRKRGRELGLLGTETYEAAQKNKK